MQHHQHIKQRQARCSVPPYLQSAAAAQCTNDIAQHDSADSAQLVISSRKFTASNGSFQTRTPAARTDTVVLYGCKQQTSMGSGNAADACGLGARHHSSRINGTACKTSVPYEDHDDVRHLLFDTTHVVLICHWGSAWLVLDAHLMLHCTDSCLKVVALYACA
jgi:hypothetical protein